MAKCPNRNRKRVGLGGGQPGCMGRVELVVSVPVVLACKRLPRGADGANTLMTHRARHSGVRVAGDVLKRLVDAGKYDTVCDQCGWSLNRAVTKACTTRRNGKK